jgi:hypothetical protein
MLLPTTFVLLRNTTIPKQALTSRPLVFLRWEATSTSHHSIHHKCMFLVTTIRVATLLTCTPITSECQNGHASHDQLWQDSNIGHPVPIPGLRSQPDLPNYPSHQPFPVQVYQDQLHDDRPYESSLHDASIPTQEEYSVSCGWLDGKTFAVGFKDHMMHSRRILSTVI